MRRSHYAILASLLVAIVFVGLNLASWKWLAPARADFTANKPLHNVEFRQARGPAAGRAGRTRASSIRAASARNSRPSAPMPIACAS
jgi:hypothetical protein